MMHATLSGTCEAGRYLSSGQLAIVGGTYLQKSSNIQLLSINDIIAVESHLEISGNFDDLEVCGVTRFAKSFVVVSTNTSCRGALHLISVDEDANGQFCLTSGESIAQHDFNYCGVAFNNYLGVVAAATEEGKVMMHALPSGEQMASIDVDACGIQALQFTNAGNLLTLGNSSLGQLKLFDMRTRNITPVASLQHDTKNHIHRRNLTSVTTHYANEYEVYCGASSGHVLQWDMRNEKCIEHKLHESSVNDLCLLPTHPGAIVSCCDDGVVSVVDLNNQVDILSNAVSDVCPMTSVSFHADSMNLLVTSRLGGVHVVNLLDGSRNN